MKIPINNFIIYTTSITFVSMSSSVDIKNKKAKFEFEFLETFTAGIQLYGTEIKSIEKQG